MGRALGTHLPNREILDAVESHGAKLLAVSATMLANVPTVCELVEEARVRFDDLRVLVGGQAFRSGSWEDVGSAGECHLQCTRYASLPLGWTRRHCRSPFWYSERVSDAFVEADIGVIA